MKKNVLIILLICIINFINTDVFAKNCNYLSKTHSDYVLQYYNYMCVEKRNGAVVYNAISLSDSQIKIRETIAQKYYPLYENYFKILLNEAKKLDSFELAKVGFLNLYCQKRVLNHYYKLLYALYVKENDEFLKCLSKEQCKKYKQIKNLEYRDLKNSCKLKDYYKSNPKMKAFGDIKTFKKIIGCSE